VNFDASFRELRHSFIGCAVIREEHVNIRNRTNEGRRDRAQFGRIRDYNHFFRLPNHGPKRQRLLGFDDSNAANRINSTNADENFVHVYIAQEIHCRVPDQ